MSAKDIEIKPINRQDADKIVKELHYSGKTVNNSQIHLGVFLNGKCGGALQFGPSMDKRKIVGIVEGTKWNDFIELNRMALADWLPKNSESRAISIAMKLLRKNYPNLEWVVSFADGMQCGDGTIYRASGFVLTGISSGSMVELPDDLALLAGSKYAHRLSLQTKTSEVSKEVLRRTDGKNMTNERYAELFGGRVVPGFMFRYLYFLNPEARDRLKVPIIPFSKIKEIGGAMYKGEKQAETTTYSCVEGADSGTGGDQSSGGGANPTSTL